MINYKFKLLIRYRVFIKYCVFSLKCSDFSELCQFCFSAGVLPAWCVYTHCHQRGKTEKGQRPEYSKIFGKNTIINEHPVTPLTDGWTVIKRGIQKDHGHREGCTERMIRVGNVYKNNF